MQKTSQTSILLLTLGCFLAFFVFGFTDNLKGPTLPAILNELRIDYGTGGNILFGVYLGFLIATIVTGFLADRFGLKLVLLLAGACLILGVSGYSVAQSVWPLSGSIFVIGLGLGALELGPNAIIVSLHQDRKGLYLNLMAVLHGLGSTLAPLFAGWLLSLSIGWRVIYRWDLLLIALFVINFLFLRFPRAEAKTELDFREIPRLAFKGNMPWFYISIAFYVAVEIGMASWLVIFLQSEHNLSVTSSNQALSLFFAMLMIGRLLGGFIVHRVGYLRSIFFASLFALTFIALGLFGPASLYFFLPLTGLCLSIIFPTLTAAVSDSHTGNTNTILGLLFTFAGIGGIIGPWLVGWGSDLFGLRSGFAINLFFAMALLISIVVLLKGKIYGKNT